MEYIKYSKKVGEQSIKTWGLKRTAVPTSIRNPFYTNTITDLDSGVLTSGSKFDDFSNAFMSANLAGLGRIW